jgi:hypothetical protein
MPRRTRQSKRRPSSWPAGYDPFSLTIGLPPRRLFLLFPDPKERRRFERKWNCWDRSLEGSAFRLSLGAACQEDKERLLKAVDQPGKVRGEKFAELERRFEVHEHEIAGLLAAVEAKPPPALPLLAA